MAESLQKQLSKLKETGYTQTESDKTFTGGGGSISSGSSKSSKPKESSIERGIVESRRKAENLKRAEITAAKEKALGQVDEAKAGLEPAYDELRAKSELSGRQAERRQKEQAGALGYTPRAGYSTSGQQKIAGDTQQRSTDYGISQQKETQELDQQSRDIERESELETIQQMGQLGLQYDALQMNEQIRQETMRKQQEEQDFQRGLDTIEASAGNYDNKIKDMKALNPLNPLIPYYEMAYKQEKEKLDTLALTSTQTSDEILTTIDEVREKNPYDNRLDELYVAYNNKITSEKSKQENALKMAQYAFEQSGVVKTQEQAKLLGMPVGTKSPEKLRQEYTTSKPYFKPESSKADEDVRVTKAYISDLQANYNSIYTRAAKSESGIALRATDPTQFDAMVQAEAERFTDRQYRLQEDFGEGSSGLEGIYADEETPTTTTTVTKDTQPTSTGLGGKQVLDSSGNVVTRTKTTTPTETKQETKVTSPDSKFIWIPTENGGMELINPENEYVDESGKVISKIPQATSKAELMQRR